MNEDTGKLDGATTVGQQLDQLAGLISVLRDRLMGMTEEAVERVAADERVKRLNQEVRELADRLSKEGKDAAGQATSFVQEQPITALGLAFGLGFLIAKILRRSPGRY